MKNLKELFMHMVTRQNTRKECKLLGQGSYSMVWDIGGDAYKLTNELSYDGAIDMQARSNKLARAGVNVAKVYEVDKFVTTTNSVIMNLKSFYNHNELRDYYRILKDFSKNFGENEGKYVYVGIKQQKIDGRQCFKEEYYRNIRVLNQSTAYGNTITRELYSNVATELTHNLDFFGDIPADQYAKFISDGAKLMQEGLTIDNYLQTNFLYDPNKGFYYIDVAGLQTLKPVENIFDSTVENVCSMCYINLDDYDEDFAKKQLDLCIVLSEGIKEVLTDENIQKQFNEYISKENSLKNMFNYAIANVDKTTAATYINSMRQIFSQYQPESE